MTNTETLRNRLELVNGIFSIYCDYLWLTEDLRFWNITRRLRKKSDEMQRKYEAALNHECYLLTRASQTAYKRQNEN